MAVPLGASLSDPRFVFAQIIHLVSVFLISMGVVRGALGVTVLIFTRSNTTSLATTLSSCFHIPLRSLFMVHVGDVDDGSGVRFFFMHLLTALSVPFPLAYTIRRRKFALDFTFTLYLVYFMLCCVVGRRLTGGGLSWWLAVATGFGVTYCASVAICKRQELQDIFLTSTPGATVAGDEVGKECREKVTNGMSGPPTGAVALKVNPPAENAAGGYV